MKTTAETTTIQKGIDFHMSGDLNRAEEVYRNLISNSSKAPVVYGNLASICMSTGRIDQGIELLHRVLELNPDSHEAYHNLGVAHRREGRLENASECFQKAIDLNPNYVEAYRKLGEVRKQQGRGEEAVSAFRQVVRLKPDNAAAHLEMGLSHWSLGNPEETVSSLNRAVEIKPDYAEALHKLGTVCLELGRLEDAVNHYRSALRHKADDAVLYNDIGVACWKKGNLEEAVGFFNQSLKFQQDLPLTYLNLGGVLKDQGELDGSEQNCRKALELKPDYPEAFNNLGLALIAQGRLEEAASAFVRALEIQPNYSFAHFNLGNVLKAQGRLDEAIDSFRRALEKNPFPEVYINLGSCIAGSTRPTGTRSKLEEAIWCYRKALELNPNCAEAYNNLGVSFQVQGNLDKSLDCLRKAVDINPDYADAYRNIGIVLREKNKLDQSISAHKKALNIRASHLGSDSVASRLGELLLELDRFPVIYENEAEIAKCREHYSSCLKQAATLASNMDGKFTAEETTILSEILFGLTNFYLGYQQMDDRDLQSAYADLATIILKPGINRFLNPRTASSGRAKIRLGIASEYLKQHNGSVWAYDWLANLPQQDYEFFLYSLNGATDEVTQKFAALGTYRWLPFGPGTYQKSLETIANDELDVLIIPDVGMTASSRIISLTRLAPVQCVGWGHPITTGSANIDYYLSSELMETEDADSHYAEELVRLPNIGLCFEQPERPPESSGRSEFNIPVDKIVFGSLQSLFKYLPQYDFVYPAIAKQVPKSVFVFVGSRSAEVTAAFETRLKKAFELADLEFSDYVKIVPRLSFEKFMQLLCTLDVCLDSIGWTGGYTTMRSLAMNCPIVTLPGEFMRGRHSYAMLKMIGLEELTAQSPDDFVSLSVRLGVDKEFRSSLKDKIERQKAALFNNKECAQYLDGFFKEKIAERRTKAQCSANASGIVTAELRQPSNSHKAEAESLYNLATSLHKQGKFDEAIAAYKNVLKITPNHASAYNDMAVALWTQGKLDDAVRSLQKALEADASYPEAYLNLGGVLRGKGEHEKAVQACQRALELRPDYVQAYNNLGLVLKDQGQHEEALAAFRKAISICSTYAQAHYNAGFVQQELGSLEEAIAFYRESLRLNPTPQSYLNLGAALTQSTGARDYQERLEEGISCYKKALELKPDYADVHNNLGLALAGRNELEEAVGCFRNAIKLRPDYREAYGNLGIVLATQNKLDESISYSLKALEMNSAGLGSDSIVRELGALLLEFGRIPVVYEESLDVAKCRDHFTSCLSQANLLVSSKKRPFTEAELEILRQLLFRVTNFYLGYQQQNDRDLQIQYANLATEILKDDLSEFLSPADNRPVNPKIRLGIASEYLKNHNGSHWAYQWLAKLPREDYEFFAYSLNGGTDEITDKFAALGTYRWLPFKPATYKQSLKTIKEDNLDVLLIPDVGMTASSRVISLTRLAPVQCVGWGHPITTGSPNIDYYLSSDLMESEEADSHYSEELVRLPNLGLYFEQPDPPSDSVTRADFGIPENKIVYGSVQSLFKYLPQYDCIFTSIARQVPNSVFVFVGDKTAEVTSAFRRRLSKAFEKEGLDFDEQVIILPRLPFGKFMDLVSLLDVYLDSIGWTGGYTTMRCLAFNCPLVTIPGEFMRGRHSYAMLKLIGIEDLIVESPDEYISLAVKLGTDKPMHSTLSEKIARNKHKLFNDMECIEFLDKFFKSKVGLSNQNRH